MLINQPSVAILIDLWDKQSSSIVPLVEKIDNFIESDKNIRCIILATYETRLEHMLYDNHWYKNTLDLMEHHRQRSQKIRRLCEVHDYYEHRPYLPNLTEKFTYPSVYQRTWPDRQQFAMRWLWQLEFILAQNPDIKTVWVFGIEFNQCVMKRPLGYMSVSEIPGITVLTHRDCIAQDLRNYPDIDQQTNWVRLDNGIYQHLPQDK